jgi:hypothetical protein
VELAVDVATHLQQRTRTQAVSPAEQETSGRQCCWTALLLLLMNVSCIIFKTAGWLLLCMLLVLLQRKTVP